MRCLRADEYSGDGASGGGVKRRRRGGDDARGGSSVRKRKRSRRGSSVGNMAVRVVACSDGTATFRRRRGRAEDVRGDGDTRRGGKGPGLGPASDPSYHAPLTGGGSARRAW